MQPAQLPDEWEAPLEDTTVDACTDSPWKLVAL